MAEFKRLLNELGDLEGWTDDERLEIQDEFSRMAPARFPAALQALREACAAALAPWPNPPQKRATLRLCVLTGRRTAEEIRREFSVIEGGKSRKRAVSTDDKEAA